MREWLGKLCVTATAASASTTTIVAAAHHPSTPDQSLLPSVRIFVGEAVYIYIYIFDLVITFRLDLI